MIKFKMAEPQKNGSYSVCAFQMSEQRALINRTR